VRLLDRYILRNFFEPFLLCFLGFISIWLIVDLSDNGPDFIQARAPISQVLGFYLMQLPQTVVMSLPVGLLLALLFMLSRMSRSNEIISILGAGRSVLRFLLPLFLIGMLVSVGCLALNYEMAPHADAFRKAALEQMNPDAFKGKKPRQRAVVNGYLFRDRLNARTWYIRKLVPGSPEFTGVHITQHDAEGGILRRWFAEKAVYRPEAGSWELQSGLVVDFTPEGDVASSVPFDQLTVSDWSETPQRITGSHVQAQDLSIPELRDHLAVNADSPVVQLAPFRTYLLYRWALPWSCLVVVLIAAPLGIVYSRRAVLGGVAASIGLFFAMTFTTNFCLALGKGARIAPEVAAWLPNALFACIGMVLLYYRSTNRDLPTFGFGRR